MKKLFIICSILMLSAFSVVKAQGYYTGNGGLSYTQSSKQPLFLATFGLSYNSGSGLFTIYLNLPSNAIGHVSYSSVRTQGASSGDVNDHNELGTSSGDFSPGYNTYVEWAIDYDDGSWQTLSGYLYNSVYTFEVSN